jgi:pimeloyl-ACP methyl ester carboxylesterase
MTTWSRLLFIIILQSNLSFAAGQCQQLFDANNLISNYKRMNLEEHRPFWIHTISTSPSRQARVIFIHGAPKTARSFEVTLSDPELSARAELVAYDRPGYGLSRDSNEIFSLDEQARVVAELIRAGEPNIPIILVGHSYGAMIALKVAQMQPTEVKTVITLSGVFNSKETRPLWFRPIAAIKSFKNLVPRLLKQAYYEIVHFEEDLTNVLSEIDRIQAPLHIVNGMNDKTVRYQSVREFQATMESEKSNLHLRPEVGHLMMQDDPVFIRELIKQALDDLAN